MTIAVFAMCAYIIYMTRTTSAACQVVPVGMGWNFCLVDHMSQQVKVVTQVFIAHQLENQLDSDPLFIHV